MKLKKTGLKKNENIGVCGATSTPMWLMENVKEKIICYLASLGDPGGIRGL